MRIGILGMGVVGQTLAAKLEELGHDVQIGSRDPERSFAAAAEHGEVRALLESFGWPPERVLDLGGIDAARALEMYLPLWLRLFAVAGTPRINIALVRGE